MTEEERAYRLCGVSGALAQCDDRGRTPLHNAAAAGKAAICRILLNGGADPTASDQMGKTAAQLARDAGHTSVAGMLESAIGEWRAAEDGATPDAETLARPLDVRELHGLVAGSTDIVSQIVAAGRMAARDARDDTPLHIAAARGHLLACSMLIEAGADHDARNAAGKTAHDLAAENGHHDIARRLAELGGNDGTDDGNTTSQQNVETISELNVTTEATSPEVEINDFEDLLDFDGEEAPEEFHQRQDIKPADGIFYATVGEIQLRSGVAEESAEWELPASLGKSQTAGRTSAEVPSDGAANVEDLFGRGLAPSRAKREALRIPGTYQSLEYETCLFWAEEVLLAGQASEEAIDAIISNCEGDWIEEDLRKNIHRVFEFAGLIRSDDNLSCGEDAWDAPCNASVTDLAEALHSAANHQVRLPGRQQERLFRRDEQLLVRAMVNARHDVLDAMLDDRHTAELILAKADAVLSGDFPAEEFTNIDIDVSDEEEETEEFGAAIEEFRSALDASTTLSGKLRRRAAAAIERMDLAAGFIDRLPALLESDPNTKGNAPRLRNAIARRNCTASDFLLAHLPYLRRHVALAVRVGEDRDELFQEAFLGLFQAAEKFDPDRGSRFHIYASYWMRQATARWRDNNAHIVRIPVHRMEKLRKAETVEREIFDATGQTPSDEEVASHVGLSGKILRTLRASLHDPIQFAEEIHTPIHQPDLLDAPGLEKALKAAINDSLADLTPRESDILRRRFGIDHPTDMTLEEVGKIYSVTRERIRQIEAGALRKLKHPKLSRRLRGFLDQ